MSWYFVDTAQVTQGPVELGVLKSAYAAKTLIDDGYVWNGTTVTDWTPLKGVPALFSQVKASVPGPPRTAPKRPAAAAAPSATSSIPAARKKPKGGMANLLGDIRKGKSLAKVGPAGGGVSKAPARGGGGGGARRGAPKDRSGDPRFAPKQSMQDQMRAALAKRRSGGGGGGARSSPSRPKTTSPAPKSSTPSWKSKSAAPKSSAPKSSWKSKSTAAKTSSAPSWRGKSSAPKSSSPRVSGKQPGAGGGDSASLVLDIKKRLDGAEEWQLKACAKILQ